MIIKVSDNQFERLQRLQALGGHQALDNLLEEMISLTDSVYSGREDGYAEVVLRMPNINPKTGKKSERILIRKYIRE